MTGPTFLLPDLAERFGLELQGVATEGVSGVATLERASAGQVSTTKVSNARMSVTSAFQVSRLWIPGRLEATGWIAGATAARIESVIRLSLGMMTLSAVREKRLGQASAPRLHHRGPR